MKAFSIAFKDVQILLKDRGALVISFLLPLVFILAFSLPQLAGVTADEKGLTLPVVNLDEGSAGQELIQGIDRAGGVRAELYEQPEAWDLLEEGEIHWLLEIPADFSALSLDHPVTLRLVNHPDANEVDTSSIQMVVQGVAGDMALKHQLIASFEQMGAMMASLPEDQQAFDTATSIAQAESQFEGSKTRPLIRIEETNPQIEGEELPPFGSTNLTVPGFTVLFVFLTAQVTASSIFQEKKQGSFRRLLSAPISRASILLGKMVPNVVLTLLQIVVVFAVGVCLMPLMGLDRLSLGNDPLALIVVSILLALCSTGMGVLISALAQSEAQIGGISAMVLWVLGAIGGAFFPTYLMSGPIQTIGSFVPHYWALRAYNDLFVYGRGLGDILPAMGILLGFTAAFFVIGLWRFDFD
ncbi:MAG: ABC transporter permease [Chloroflexia bacterium]|nr:ABC transporter permease [Chloroflexia bacterium]